MKRKVLISFLAILLFLALTSCGMVPPGESAEDMAEESVYHYWQAIINRQYELAKCYCITDGIWYNKTDEWEEYINDNSEGNVSLMIYGPSFYEETEVIGDTATVYVWISVHKIMLSDIYGGKVDTFEYETELIKQNHPPGEWELK